MSLKEARQFVAHFVKGEYAPEEYANFLQWLKKASTEELNEIADEHEALHDRWSLSSAGPSPEWVAQLEQKLDKAGVETVEAPVRWINPSRFTRKKVWFAAASMVILVTSGTYWYRQQASVKTDVQHTTKLLAQTFSVGKGQERKQIVLADGSKVWLNAASTLKYPAAFSGKERVVQLSGEAFFEVSGNPDMPFRVMIQDATIEVLGTAFNVMAYEDEPYSRTTLVDGSVKIASGAENATLKAGEQAEIAHVSGGVAPIRVTSGVSSSAVLAWRNGFLEFKNEDLPVVMREIGRAFNVEIKYESTIPEKKITGSFSRKDGLTKILEQLSNLSIHFSNDGKTVTVIH